jgi:hypothetical protein
VHGRTLPAGASVEQTARKHIEHNGQVHEIALQLDLGDVRAPHLVGTDHLASLQEIRTAQQGVRPAEMAKTLNLPGWTVSKLQTQAHRHSFSQLLRAMERILAADEAIKTGKMGDREAMDVLLAELLAG